MLIALTRSTTTAIADRPPTISSASTINRSVRQNSVVLAYATCRR